MKKFLLLMLLLISSNIVWAAVQTPSPVINYEIYDEYVLVTAIGEGEVCLYLNGDLVENPCEIYRSEDDVYVIATATAQNPGEEISYESFLEIFIPAFEGYEDPHSYGCWVVLLDRNNIETWYPLYLGSDGDYATTLEPYCYIYGCTYWSGSYFCDYTPIDTTIPSREFYDNTVYDARFYFVINGIKYGPEDNYKECVAGYALPNPLYECDNYYTMKTGFPTTVAFVDYTGDLYAYIAYSPYSYEYDENFPTPSIDYKLGDVDGDGNVNIADLSELIDLLLNGNTTYNPGADVDEDGQLGISDVSELIDILLKSN